MKHILPILTLALIGAAVTAFADVADATPTANAYRGYYYDYYLRANISFDPDPGDGRPPFVTQAHSNNVDVPNVGSFKYENDSVTYNAMSADSTQGNIIMSTDTYTIRRDSDWSSTIRKYNKNNFFLIEIGDNSQNVELYLTDFVSNLYPDSPYNSTSNALFNDGYDIVYETDEYGNDKTDEVTGEKIIKEKTLKQRAIVEYGYRKLTRDETNGKYYVAEDDIEPITRDTVVRDDANGALTIDGLEGKYKLNEENVTPIDSVTTGDNTVTRYQYYLGTFEPGDIIEVYMKDSTANGTVFSYSSNVVDGDYRENLTFDPTSPYLDANNSYVNPNDENQFYTKAQGGFSDGGWATLTTETDDMLDSYYFDKEASGQEYHNYTAFDSYKTYASQKAMPLSQLIPGTWRGMGVAFGLLGVTSGESIPGGPLPGGLPIALIAGLFGLGFCYVRRRKAIAG